MATRFYNGAGLPPAPGQEPDDMTQHRVRPMPPPRMPPPPTPEQVAAQRRALGELDEATEDVAPPLRTSDTGGLVAPERQILEWPFSGTVYLTLDARQQLEKATVQLTGERGTVVKEGATIAEAAIAALGEFEEAMAKEGVEQTLARILGEAATQEEAVAQIMALLQGGTQ